MKKYFSIYLLLVSLLVNQFVFGQCALTLTASSTSTTCIGCNDGTASVSVSGGTAPYTYVWTNNVAAGTASIVASKDNSIYEQSTGNSNGAGDYFVAGETAAGFKTRALMAFDIAGNIPAGASITNASLQLFIYLTSGTTGAQNHLLHKLEQNWGEGGSFATQPGQGAPATTNDATWLKNFFPGSDWVNSGGSFDPAESAATIVNAAQSFYTWSSPSMVADVQSWLNTPSSNFGWLLRSEETGPKQAKRYASKENSTAAWRPRLTVNYGPVVIGNTSSVSNLAPGTYIVTINDANNCTATASVTITAPSVLPNIISQDFVCTSDRVWLITGKVYVKDGATIFIDEGTVLKGTPAATAELASALVITRTGRIEATGSAENPIVFTTTVAAPVKGTGYWGGVVILGSAPINQTTDQQIEGINLPSVPPGVDVFYGGGSMGAGNATENSGIMNYVRIEYAGAAIAPNNELNSLTCGGVGNGTFIDFVQAVYGADDAFEFFGGTVNAKHLVALAPDDDAFDFDFGYVGNIQFAVSIENINKPAYSANPNGIESDGDATGNVASLPRTKAVISNMTVIGMVNATQAGPQPAGRALLQGAHIRRNSSYIIRNSIFMGFPVGVRLESTGTIGDLSLAQNFQNNLVHGFTAVAYQGNATTAIALPASNTSILGETGFSNATIDLTNPFDEAAPDFRPSLTSPAATGASLAGLPAFFTTAGVTYRGAFSTSTAWTNSWTRFF